VTLSYDEGLCHPHAFVINSMKSIAWTMTMTKASVMPLCHLKREK